MHFWIKPFKPSMPTQQTDHLRVKHLPVKQFLNTQGNLHMMIDPEQSAKFRHACLTTTPRILILRRRNV